MTDNDRNVPRPERPATKDQDPLLELTRLFNLDFNANGNSPARQPDENANSAPSPQAGSQNDGDLPFLENQPQDSGTLTNARQTVSGNAPVEHDGRILLFRPEANAERFHNSAIRLAMPPIGDDVFLAAINELVKIDRNWIPETPDSSLYLRPFMQT